MKVNSKEKFIKLLVSTMAKMGYIIETYDFENDLIMMMSIAKYDDLFYFFNDISDFYFTDILLEMNRDGLIKVSSDMNNIKIEIVNKMFYTVSDEILKIFSPELINLMAQMIRELDLSKQMSQSLPENVHGIYRLANPNRIYGIGDNHSIITDGMVVGVNTTTNACLVQNANYVFLQRFYEDKLAEMQLYYKFDDQRFLLRRIKEILDFYRYLDGQQAKREEFSKYKKLTGINGYRCDRY